jgi:hypothetical protein
MDFEVFLVSQIKEHADAGEDRKRSVVSGLLNNGRVITAAATIMVFGSFVLDAPRTVKPFGHRPRRDPGRHGRPLPLVPARTASLGKANWYLPRWLGKIFPRISIECEKYFKACDRIPAPTQLQAPQVSAAQS